MVGLFGVSSGRRLVMGFMAATAVLSMWISNTATTLMMLPVALAVLDGVDDKSRLGPPLLLGIAYAASIGGLGTPIGTPPNLIFMQVYEQTTGQTISFTQWMGWALPVVVLMVPATAMILTRNLGGALQLQLPTAGPWRTHERRVLLVFGLTAVAWITRSEPFGGWMTWLNLPEANDASVALLAVVLMFLVPDGKGQRLLNWEHASTIPWGVLLLFSGGICLAQGFVSSGMSELIGQWLSQMTRMPLFALIVMICLVVTFLTETTSNTASCRTAYAGAGSCGPGSRNCPGIDDGAGGDERQLCVYAARRHSAEHDSIRQRADYHRPHGAGGLPDQLAGCRRYQ